MKDRQFELPGFQEIKEQEKPRHIWMEFWGVPASGKTTAGEIIAEELGFTYIGEIPVDEVPLFDKYYTEPEKYALPVQMIFLYESRLRIKGSKALKVEGIKDLLEKSPVISEPPIQQNTIYALTHFLNFPDKQKVYDTWYEGLVERDDDLPLPDLLYHLQLSRPTFRKRVRERVEKAEEGSLRKKELKATDEYWNMLWDLHENWIRQNPFGLRIITIDGDRFDFSRYRNLKKAKSDLLEEFLNWTKYAIFDPNTDKSRLSEDIIIPEVILNHRPTPGYKDKLPFKLSISGMPCDDR